MESVLLWWPPLLICGCEIANVCRGLAGLVEVGMMRLALILRVMLLTALNCYHMGHGSCSQESSWNTSTVGGIHCHRKKEQSNGEAACLQFYCESHSVWKLLLCAYLSMKCCATVEL